MTFGKQMQNNMSINMTTYTEWPENVRTASALSIHNQRKA